jgi:hypothetical protein
MELRYPSGYGPIAVATGLVWFSAWFTFLLALLVRGILILIRRPLVRTASEKRRELVTIFVLGFAYPATVILRPLYYPSMWLSSGALERRAAAIAAEPFANALPSDPVWVGLYYVHLGKCPHYVYITPCPEFTTLGYKRMTDRWDIPTMLVYRWDSGNCQFGGGNIPGWGKLEYWRRP